MIRHQSKITQLELRKDSLIQIQCKPQQTHTQWKQIKIPSNFIHPRSHHSSVVYKNKLYIYGGYQTGAKGILEDFICFNLQTNQWEKISQNQLPGKRHSHSLILYENSLFLFGGIINTLQSDNRLFQYDLINRKWSEKQQSGTIPTKINSHKTIVFQDKMILIGGLSQGNYVDKVYELDLKTFEWKIKKQMTDQCPKARVDFSICQREEKIYIFGGKSFQKMYNQLWVYNYATNKFNQLISQKNFIPKQRCKHGAIFYKQKLFIFGGTTGITHERNDLIIFDLQTNIWQRYWEDSQTQRIHQKDKQQEIISKSIKKPVQNNIIAKLTNSGFCQSQKKHNQQKQNTQKYRKQIKQQNYYNQQYPCFLDSKYQHPNKMKKNDLIVNLQKQCTKQIMQIHLSQTFQSLNQSVLHCLLNNNGKLQTPSNEQYLKKKKYPKSRDGHSCFQDINQQLKQFSYLNSFGFIKQIRVSINEYYYFDKMIFSFFKKFYLQFSGKLNNCFWW